MTHQTLQRLFALYTHSCVSNLRSHLHMPCSVNVGAHQAVFPSLHLPDVAVLGIWQVDAGKRKRIGRLTNAGCLALTST